ncbi:MAG: D-aminoacyl-tRNA deacylase [Cardiobacteriaceae bacterium]|nr:D-aminoacyl-tRNA deacylase [Cardiobacteriaceae bacterium]
MEMIALVQRVRQARVAVDGDTIANIGCGILALVAAEKSDTWPQAEKLAEKLLNYRIFPDDNGRMNLSLRDTGHSLLLVSQFTLAANTRKGNRPGFDNAMPPELAEPFFARFCTHLQTLHTGDVQTGRFAADMQVALINDGPVTFWLQS